MSVTVNGGGSWQRPSADGTNFVQDNSWRFLSCDGQEFQEDQLRWNLIIVEFNS